VHAQFSFITNNGQITITGYDGLLSSVTIPSSTNGLPVTAIATNAFFEDFGLIGVTIPDSITSIGAWAFFDTGLTNVIIPASVTNIGIAAFAGTSLAEFEVDSTNPAYSSPDGVLFNQSETLLVAFPNGYASNSYSIPNSVTDISDYAFYDSYNLTNVNIDANVMSIGTNAFDDSFALESITVALGNPAFSSPGGVLFDLGQTTLIQYPIANPAGFYAVPNTVTNIMESAFDFAESLTNLTIGSGVAGIGTNAFSDCGGLIAFAVDSNNPAFSSVAGVLFDKAQTTLVAYPGNAPAAYAIPSSVTSIGQDAFYDCANLASIMIPDTVTNIGEYAFYNCSDLTNVSMGNGVISIGNDAFLQCNILMSIALPDSITSIGSAAFENCALTNVIIGAGLTSIGDQVFAFDTSLRSVTIPDTVTSIGNSSFADCGLTNLAIPDSVTTIGNSAFYHCVLGSVTIAGSVTNIGPVAFGFCPDLKGIYFQGNAPNVDASSFYDDSATNYYLPGTTGWSNFASETGLPTLLWNPLIQAANANFGVHSNLFGFNITSTAPIPIVLEACTNLAAPVWVPLTNLTLPNGTFHFTDPQWTNHHDRFYRISAP
jgi:hypothetical protein